MEVLGWSWRKNFTWVFHFKKHKRSIINIFSQPDKVCQETVQSTSEVLWNTHWRFETETPETFIICQYKTESPKFIRDIHLYLCGHLTVFVWNRLDSLNREGLPSKVVIKLVTWIENVVTWPFIWTQEQEFQKLWENKCNCLLLLRSPFYHNYVLQYDGVTWKHRPLLVTRRE